MARMSREFSLVLLGAGLLTAGYFMMPEPDPVQRAHDDATGGADGNANNSGRSGTRYRTGHVMIFYAAGGSRPFASSTRTSYSSSTMRGGFGRTGSSSIGG